MNCINCGKCPDRRLMFTIDNPDSIESKSDIVRRIESLDLMMEKLVGRIEILEGGNHSSIEGRQPVSYKIRAETLHNNLFDAVIEYFQKFGTVVNNIHKDSLVKELNSHILAKISHLQTRD